MPGDEVTERLPGLYPKERRKAKEPTILPEVSEEDLRIAAERLDPWLVASIVGCVMPELPKAFEGLLAWIVLRRANRIGKRFSSGEIQLLLQYITEDAQITAKYPGEATRINAQRQSINNMFRPAGEADYQEHVEDMKRFQEQLDQAKRRGAK